MKDYSSTAIVEQFVTCLFRGHPMTPTLYYLPPSPPCRSVLLVGRMLGIDFDLKTVNVLDGEQLKLEFTQINPQHTIPTLVDHGLVLWESRVIMTYLVSAYGKDDKLYPKDPRTRALVDQRLHFDLGTLYQRMSEYFVSSPSRWHLTRGLTFTISKVPSDFLQSTPGRNQKVTTLRSVALV
jgi:Glutathione S-transferase, N-terminal domain